MASLGGGAKVSYLFAHCACAERLVGWIELGLIRPDVVARRSYSAASATPPVLGSVF